jgi:antitoxin MazE
MGASLMVSRWGNSLAVRLPKKLVEEMGVKEGDELTIVTARIGVIEVESDEDRRSRAVGRMVGRGWKIAPGYRFDRDEANER